jgi:hypothetical protein
MEIATAAVALLAPYLAKAGEAAAGKAGEAAVSGARALLKAIRGRFDADDDQEAKQTLEQFEQQPDDEERQAELARVLSEKAETDPDFREELQRRVDDATGGRSVNEFLTQVYGGEVGKIVNIGQARDVTF